MSAGYCVAGEIKKVVGLVGKGLTFDSGGYNLKVQGGIEMMKYDMGGAGAVLGAAQALAELQPEGVQASACPCPACMWHRRSCSFCPFIDCKSNAYQFSPSFFVRGFLCP